MARNTGRGHRQGAVTRRTQFLHNGVYFKRDATTGRILNGRTDGKPHKGVAQEPDGRRS